MCTVQAPSHLGSRTMAVAAADEEAVYPPSKRIRSSSEKTGASTRAGTPPKSLDSQRLFAPFRALGIITNNVPFALQLRAVKGSAEGPRVHILTCLGNSWALWEGRRKIQLRVWLSMATLYGPHLVHMFSNTAEGRRCVQLRVLNAHYVHLSGRLVAWRTLWGL